MNGTGHGNKLTAGQLISIEGWRRDGVVPGEIAARMGISEKTLLNRARHEPALAKALEYDRETTDFQVELALLSRALGYEYSEETWELKPNKETGEAEMILTKRQVKHMQPDVSAITFWLKKRRPDIWGDSPEPDEAAGDTGVVFMPPVLTAENDN